MEYPHRTGKSLRYRMASSPLSVITGSKKDLVLVEQDPVREILSRLDVYLFYASMRVRDRSW